MNEKLSLQQLAELLPEDVFGTDAERRASLVSEIFGIVADSLAAGENVSVKGIGSFQPTGNMMSPVSFEPSASFTDIVNAPFAAFEPVELAESFTDELLRNELAEEEAEAPALPEPAAEEPEEPAAAGEPEEPTAAEPQEPSAHDVPQASRFGNGFFWGLLTGLVIGAILFMAYVMVTTPDVPQSDIEPVLDEETASAALETME